MIIDIRDHGASPDASPEANTRAVQAAVDAAGPGDRVRVAFDLELARPLYLHNDFVGLVGPDPTPTPGRPDGRHPRRRPRAPPRDARVR